MLSTLVGFEGMIIILNSGGLLKVKKEGGLACLSLT